MAPFLEKILAGLVAGKSPLLILDARDLWVFDFLEIKPHQLLRDCRNRSQPGKTSHPGHDSFYAVLQRRGQPTRRPAAVVEPRAAVPGASVPATTPGRPATVEFGFDSGATVCEDCREDHNLHGFVDDGHPGFLAPGIQLQPERLDLSAAALLENDSERKSPDDGGLTASKKFPCPNCRGRHQRFSDTTEYKYRINVQPPFQIALTGTPLRGNVCLANVRSAFAVFRLADSPYRFVLIPTEPGTGTHPKVS